MFIRNWRVVHDGCKDRICDSCGKSFSYAHHLVGHICTVHEGHKDYNCDTCGKLFSQPHHMKTHINEVHDGH